jgi:hypothetical protein
LTDHPPDYGQELFVSLLQALPVRSTLGAHYAPETALLLRLEPADELADDEELPGTLPAFCAAATVEKLVWWIVAVAVWPW